MNRGRRGAIAGQSATLFPANARTPSIDQHSQWWRTQNVAKRLGATGGAGPGTRNGRSARGRRVRELPCRPFPSLSDTAGQSVDVAGGWARKTAGSGRVSGAVVHLSKSRHAMQQGSRSPTSSGTPSMGDHRPTAGRSLVSILGSFPRSRKKNQTRDS